MTSHEHGHNHEHQKTPPLQRIVEISGVAAILALLASAAGFQFVKWTEIKTGTRPDGLYFWSDAASGFGMVAAAGLCLSMILRSEWESITRWIKGRIPQRQAVSLMAAAVAGVVTVLAGAAATAMARRSAEFLGETGAQIAGTAPVLAWTGGIVAAWAIVAGAVALTRGTPQEPLAQ